MKQFVIALILVAAVNLIAWAALNFWLPITEYVEVERIVYVDVIRVVTEEVEKVVTEYVEVERVVTQIEYVQLVNGYDFRLSDNTTMSAWEALLWLDNGIASHQYYIDHPELQNKGTGDTAFNEQVILQYLRARSLIEEWMKLEGK